MRKFFLAALALMSAAAVQGADVYAVLHPWFNREAVGKVVAEIRAKAKIPISGFRISWGAPEFGPRPDGTFREWAMVKVREELRLFKSWGLKVSVSVSNDPWSRWIMQETAIVYGPTEASFHQNNEPSEFPQRVVSQALIESFKGVEAYWDSSGLKARGYKLYGPVMHGIMEGPSDFINKGAQWPPSYECYAQVDFWKWVYRDSGYRDALKAYGLATNLYASGNAGADTDRIATDKLDALLQLRKMHFSYIPWIAVTEFNALADPTVSEYWRWYKTGAGLKAMSTRPVDFVTLYVMNGHEPECLVANDGTIYATRLKGFIAGLGLKPTASSADITPRSTASKASLSQASDSAPVSPRLYAVYFPSRPPEDAERETQLAVELGFAGLRLGYPPIETVTADNRDPVSAWAERWIDADIARIQKKGLKVHLGLGGTPKPGASDDVNFGTDTWVAEGYMAAFGPDRLSFHLTNEPEPWHQADPLDPYKKVVLDRALVTRWNRLHDWLDARARPKGYRIYGPTFEGGQEWRSSTTSIQLFDYGRYVDRIVNTDEYRWVLYRARQNFSLYVPNTADSPRRPPRRFFSASIE